MKRHLVVLYWIPMTIIGMLNGIFRGFVLMLFLSEFHAKQVSSLLLVLLLFFYVKAILGKLHLQSKKDAIFTGLTWSLLTIGFEFFLGYVLLKRSLDVITQEYNLLAGNLWSLVILAIFFLPYWHFSHLFQTSKKT